MCYSGQGKGNRDHSLLEVKRRRSTSPIEEARSGTRAFFTLGRSKDRRVQRKKAAGSSLRWKRDAGEERNWWELPIHLEWKKKKEAHQP